MTRRFPLAAPTALLALLLIAPTATAQTTYVVTKTADTNDGTCNADCSLREALATANALPGADRIEFAPAVQGQTIALQSAFGQLGLNDDVVIDAEPGGVTLDAGQQGFRVMAVNTGVVADLVGLTVTGGQVAGDGGGLYNLGGTLSLTRSTITDNSAGNWGGGIYNTNGGTLTVTESTIRVNAAGGFSAGGGGIFNNGGTTTVTRSTITANQSTIGNSGGLYNLGGTLTVTGSTITANYAGLTGGGIYNTGGATTTVTRTTITGNFAVNGGGGLGNAAGSTYTVANSTLSGNGGGNIRNGTTTFPGTLVSAGFNVCDDACGLTGTGDLVNTDPLLGPLADNGGPTLTHLPLAGSPAIDIGGTCGPTDQRGFLAQADDVLCDAGSVEVGSVEVPANAPPVAHAGPDQTVIAGQTVTLDGAGSSDPDDDALTFTWTLSGAPLAGADTASPSFCAATPGAYTATLTVSDGTDDSEPDAVLVTALSGLDAVGEIQAGVAALFSDGTLTRDQARLLLRTVTRIQAALGRRKTDGTLRGLSILRAQIVALWQDEGVLTEAQAEALVVPIDALSAALASPCTPVGPTIAAVPSASVTAPAGFGLDAPYPNPASGRTTVRFALEEAGPIRVAVYDLLGREVAVLVDGTVEAGAHTATLDGAALPTGTYLVRLVTAEGQTATQRLTVVR